jgi:hypothetical protein
MPPRQQFVVQLGITEVQWNQRLPVSRGHLAACGLKRHRLFPRQSDLARAAIHGSDGPGKR